MSFFHVEVPCPLHQIIHIRYKEVFNSKKSTKSSTKNCNSKKLRILQNVF